MVVSPRISGSGRRINRLNKSGVKRIQRHRPIQPRTLSGRDLQGTGRIQPRQLVVLGKRFIHAQVDVTGRHLRHFARLLVLPHMVAVMPTAYHGRKQHDDARLLFIARKQAQQQGKQKNDQAGHGDFGMAGKHDHHHPPKADKGKDASGHQKEKKFDYGMHGKQCPEKKSD